VLVADIGDGGDAAHLAAALNALGAEERVAVVEEDGAVRGFARAAYGALGFDETSRRFVRQL
jgi:hypothetical protein